MKSKEENLFMLIMAKGEKKNCVKGFMQTYLNKSAWACLTSH
jgi:hypothetical protein